jgi:DinB superfamily
METHADLRDLLARLLTWEDAHVSFDAAVAGIPVAHRGTVPSGLPHSPWQLVEHLRRAQHDILDFCVNPAYEELRFPDDYWPLSAAPPSDAAWDESIDAVRRDRVALQQLARDARIDLSAQIPHGSGQTYARELVLAADHAAYHVGQLVLVRRALGDWK